MPVYIHNLDGTSSYSQFQEPLGNGLLSNFLRLERGKYNEEEQTHDAGKEFLISIGNPNQDCMLDYFQQLPAQSSVESPEEKSTDDFQDVDLSEDYSKTHKMDRQKKDNHNKVERRRRYNINDRIKDLGDLLPKENEPFHEIVQNVRHNKGSVLRATVEYVKVLKREKSKQTLLEEKCKLQEYQNKKLLLKLREYELAMSSFDIQTNFLDSSKVGIKVEKNLVSDEVVVKEESPEDNLSFNKFHNIFEDDRHPLSRSDPMLSDPPKCEENRSPRHINSSCSSTCSSLDSFDTIDMDL